MTDHDNEGDNGGRMSDTMTDTTPADITEDDVIAFIESNPDILSRNPDLLDKLQMPKLHQGGGVADFQYYMVQRLRADRDGVIEEAREIVETSRANMDNQTRIFKAVTRLLEARRFDEFIQTITMDFATILNVDIVALAVESDGDVIPHINISGVRAIPAGTVARLCPDHNIQLHADTTGLEEIYGGGASLVRSQALVRLEIAAEAPFVLLAFGSRDPEMFQPGQGTELLSFLSRVVERCMRIWLDV